MGLFTYKVTLLRGFIGWIQPIIDSYRTAKMVTMKIKIIKEI